MAIATRSLRTALLCGVIAGVVAGCGSAAAADPPMRPRVGQVVKMGHLQVRDLSVNPLSAQVASGLFGAGSTKYETVTYAVTNPTPEPQLFMPRVQTLLADKHSYSPDRDATSAIGQSLIPRVVGPEQTVRCVLVFALPQAATVRAIGLTNDQGIEWRINTG
jgi:hypothetical protein